MKVKMFKNGNFNVKYESDYDYNDSLIEQLCNSAELDFVPADSFDMYYPLYNAYTDRLYLPTGSDCHKYKQGKTVKLRGYVMDDYDRQVLSDFIGGIER